MAKQPIRTGRIVAPTAGGRPSESELRTGMLVGCQQNIGMGGREVRTGGYVVTPSYDADLGKGMAGEKLVAPTYDGMTGAGMAGMRLVRPPENQDA